MYQVIRNLSFFKKTILFSSFIVLIVGFATATISYHFQSNTTKQILSDQAVSVSNLWKTTFSTRDILTAMGDSPLKEQAKKKLIKQLDLINEKHSNYSQGYLFSAHIPENKAFNPIATPQSIRDKGFGENSRYIAGEDFYDAFVFTVTNKTSTYTDIYSDDFGTWITAFSPIFNEYGDVIAVLGVDIEASILFNWQFDLMVSLMVACLILFTIIFTLQEWGLRKVMTPIKELFEGINQVSRGNFSVRLKDLDKSDLGELSKQFNAMTRQLHILFERVAVTSEQFGHKPETGKDLYGFEDAIDDMESIIRRNKLQGELQRAEKMNAIGQLAASVAHEIRNPMTVVKGFLQLFQTKEKMTDEEKEYIMLMIGEMNRAETIINDYLSLAKPDIEKLEKIDCGDIIRNVTELISSYALLTSKIDIKLNIEEYCFIKGNKSELKQVLLNIMKNAIEAMNDQGVLTISLRKENDIVQFEISDTGIGMTKEEVQRLGTPFYSLKEKGTGIGLMVCYQIIEKMKGTITVKSEKGNGTNFSISIPSSS